MKVAKLLVSTAAAATLIGCTAAPAFADVLGGAAYSTQTTTIGIVNTVLSPTGANVHSTWIYVALPGTTIPVDPPIVQV